MREVQGRPSVERLCNLPARSRLLTADEVCSVHQRWRTEAGDKAATGSPSAAG
jgi:hypothetical protein